MARKNCLSEKKLKAKLVMQIFDIATHLDTLAILSSSKIKKIRPAAKPQPPDHKGLRIGNNGRSLPRLPQKGAIDDLSQGTYPVSNQPVFSLGVQHD